MMNAKMSHMKENPIFTISIWNSQELDLGYQIIWSKNRKKYPGMYKGKSLACQWCLQNDDKYSTLEPPAHTQYHVYQICPAYQDLRDRLDIQNNDADKVVFFKIIIDRLTENEDT